MSRTGHIHAADPAKSRRLQAVLEALRKAGQHGLTTRELISATGCCAINSIAAELRAAGWNVVCEFTGQSLDGARVYTYRLFERAQGELF